MTKSTEYPSRRGLILAAGMAASIVAGTSAETVILDFDSESGFTGDDRFMLETQHLHWWGDGYATQGVLYAWDMENDEAALGSLKVTAAEEFVLQAMSFELGGYRDTSSSLSFEFYVDGILQDEMQGLEFEGDSTLFSLDLPGISGSSFEIVIDNYFSPAFVGLDNVAFEINNVPAPGVLALLGLAGVAGNRRRRR